MEQTYTLNRAAIAAHLHIAPKKDVRFYLNGVYLNPAKGHLVSTDGSCLLLTEHAEFKRQDTLPVILPRAELAAALKLCPKVTEYFELDVAPATDADKPATLTFRPSRGIQTSCAALDGRYPDYPRVIPATVDGTAGNFDPQLVACMGDALQALGNCKSQQQVRMYQNGPNKAAWMMLDGSSAAPHVGVIMPLRTHDDTPLASVTGNVAALLRG